MTFKIEKSKLTGVKGELFLIGSGKDQKHCHCFLSVSNLLNSNVFRKNNKSLISIFEKAYKMMSNNETGNIKL